MFLVVVGVSCERSTNLFYDYMLCNQRIKIFNQKRKKKKKKENESSHKIELGTKHLQCPPQGQTWKEKQITWDG